MRLFSSLKVNTNLIGKISSPKLSQYTKILKCIYQTGGNWKSCHPVTLSQPNWATAELEQIDLMFPDVGVFPRKGNFFDRFDLSIRTEYFQKINFSLKFGSML